MILGETCLIIVPNSNNNFHEITFNTLKKQIPYSLKEKTSLEIFILNKEIVNGLEFKNHGNILKSLEFIHNNINNYRYSIIVRNNTFFTISDLEKFYIDLLNFFATLEDNGKLFGVFTDTFSENNFMLVNNQHLYYYDIISFFRKVSTINKNINDNYLLKILSKDTLRVDSLLNINFNLAAEQLILDKRGYIEIFNMIDNEDYPINSLSNNFFNNYNPVLYRDRFRNFLILNKLKKFHTNHIHFDNYYKEYYKNFHFIDNISKIIKLYNN